MLASFIIGTAVYAYFESLTCAIVSFLTGVLLDLDHLIDCYINYGLRFKLKDFYDYCMDIRFKRLSLIFHSYELVVLLWLLIFVFSLPDVWKAAAIGVTQHIIFDQLANAQFGRVRKRGYFLSFRLRNRFKKERIIKG